MVVHKAVVDYDQVVQQTVGNYEWTVHVYHDQITLCIFQSKILCEIEVLNFSLHCQPNFMPFEAEFVYSYWKCQSTFSEADGVNVDGKCQISEDIEQRNTVGERLEYYVDPVTDYWEQVFSLYVLSVVQCQ